MPIHVGVWEVVNWLWFSLSHKVCEFLIPFSVSKMPLSLNVSGADKNNLLVSLGALILSDASLEISSDNIMALVTSSGNDVPAYYATLYANYIEKAGGVDKFLAGPSAGGKIFFFLCICS